MLSSAKAVKWLFGVAIAGALGFGATGAAASVRGSAGCPPFDFMTGEIGACNSALDCSFWCEGYYPYMGGESNNCRRGCCLCAI